MEVAADADRVAGLPHRADSLACEDPLEPLDQGRPWHVGVEVASRLTFAVDQLRALDGEDVVVVGTAAVGTADPGSSRSGKQRQR